MLWLLNILNSPDMIKIFTYLKKYLGQLIGLVVLVFVSVALTLELPGYMAKIINEGIIKANTNLILNNGLIMIVITLGGVVCTVAVNYLSTKIATSVSRDVRNDVFARVESFSLLEFNSFSTSSLITRSTNDVQQVQRVIMMLLRIVLQAPVMGLWAIVKAYQLAPSLSWVIALAVIVLLGVITIVFSIALPKFKILQQLIDRLNLVTRENLTGLRVIRAFNNEGVQQEKFEEANLDLTKTNLFVSRLMTSMQPAMMLIFNISSVLIVWFGAKLINLGSLSIGSMMAFMQYAMQVISAFLMLSMVFIMLPRALVSVSRINEVLDTEPKIKDPENPKDLNDTKRGLVEFRNVSFFYPGAESPVLEDISFKACPGETTAFIGSTGSGKSTLINLIPRLYDVSSGEILINGINVTDFKLEDLYKKIAYVPQKGVLFSGTVESNIKYGTPEATELELKKSAETAQAKEFIENLEDKYAASISQGGVNISGGQKQRLAIARAIIKKPEIFIFDDSFSALDFKTDSDLRQALKKEIKDKTVLLVAQRISTILSAEKIIVLDNGKIVGTGTHQELFKNCSIYREIAESQLSEKELKNLL